MKRAARPIRAYIEKKLKERFPDCQTSYFDAPSQKYLAENQEKYAAWAKEMDAVITAVGDWGGCTKFLTYNSVEIEDFGTPVVLLANRGFVDDAHSAASSKNMPTLRVLGEPITCESTVAEDIESGIDEVFDNIVAALTRPLTEQEKSPQLKIEKAPRIAFKGNLTEVNQFF